MTDAYVNTISPMAPAHNMHQRFIQFAHGLLPDTKSRRLFQRMAQLAQINTRYSVLTPHADDHKLDNAGFYQLGAFPTTAKRMHAYKHFALPLARQAIEALPVDITQATHLIVVSCTGFYAPGLDWDIMTTYGLSAAIERTHIGFMGCNAALNGLKMARHIVRSDPDAKVLMVNMELCTLHLQETHRIESLLAFLIFGDGCAASWITADPVGIKLNRFNAAVLPNTQDLITWHIGDNGFDMVLSGQVPIHISQQLPGVLSSLFTDPLNGIPYWAIHPGGRSVLDAAEKALPANALQSSRQVLQQYGNMSSATLMFVLHHFLTQPPGQGCAMAFGPGISVESLVFEVVPHR
jgi:alpha-pyrone synthase